LGRSLYFLYTDPADAISGVYILAHGASSLRRLSTVQDEVVSFDVWAVDDRLAYSTTDGRLIVSVPGDDAYSISVGGGHTGFHVQSMDWSPDGSELAFAVTYDGWFTQDPLPQVARDLAGLFLLDIETHTTTKILSHGVRERAGSESIVATRRVYTHPEWAPDGEAILLRDQRWELDELAWLYPLDRQGQGSVLRKPPVGLISGRWSSDSQYLYVSLCAYCFESDMDLVRINRQTAEAETLIDGEEDRLWVTVILVTPEHLILGASSPEHDTRLFEAAPNDPLGTLRPIGPSGFGCQSTWTIDPDARELAVLCRETLRILSLSSTETTDLTPLFNSLYGRLDIGLIEWGMPSSSG